jgi:3'-phosphoadenosine 5'-phosphosulfate (PAPS) 3'-phosphatase
MAWIGRKKLAFVPVYRPNAKPPDQIPQDWFSLIEQRIFYDPDPITGADRSLRTYIHTVSSGLADLDALIWEMQTIDQQEVLPNALEGAPGPFGETLGSWLRSHEKCDAAALVMLGGVGAGTSAGFWCRFVMAEGVGVWAMEFMHSLTGFRDLYPFGGNMGSFDEMACACGTHPSAFTKRAIQWLDPSAIHQHTLQDLEGKHTLHNQGFELYSVGLIQPPPGSSKKTAVQIGSKVPYYMVEARKKVDQFDSGIPSQGVIVYRIQTTDALGHAQNETAPIQLMTPLALAPGQVFVTEDTTISVSVTAVTPSGFLVIIDVSDWTSVSEGRSTPGAPVTAVVTGPNRVTLFLADPGGGVFTTSGSYEASWGPWRSVSEGSTTPGARISAVVTGPNRVTLFLADPGGGVFTTSGNYDAGWGPWRSVSEGRSTPGAPVSAMVTGPNRVTLFLADPGGGVFTTSGSYDARWGPWRSVSEGSSTPGAPITAVVTGPNRVTLFLADPGGGVFTTSGNYDAGWGPWRSVSEGSSTPGAPVSAVVTGPNRVTLFLADRGGGIYTTSGNYDGGWGPWRRFLEGRSRPGAPITAAVTGANRAALFQADRNGGVFTSDPGALSELLTK